MIWLEWGSFEFQKICIFALNAFTCKWIYEFALCCNSRYRYFCMLIFAPSYILIILSFKLISQAIQIARSPSVNRCRSVSISWCSVHLFLCMKFDFAFSPLKIHSFPVLTVSSFINILLSFLTMKIGRIS